MLFHQIQEKPEHCRPPVDGRLARGKAEVPQQRFPLLIQQMIIVSQPFVKSTLAPSDSLTVYPPDQAQGTPDFSPQRPQAIRRKGLAHISPRQVSIQRRGRLLFQIRFFFHCQPHSCILPNGRPDGKSRPIPVIFPASAKKIQKNNLHIYYLISAQPSPENIHNLFIFILT